MKLPPDSDIPAPKLTHYLLVLRGKNDKSQWLARAGYTLENHALLAADLRAQILPLDARPSRQSPFGDAFEITGTLTGPPGVSLKVRTVWLKDRLSGRFRFITLVPYKGKPA